MQKCNQLRQLSGNLGLIEKGQKNGYKMKAKYKLKLVQIIEAAFQKN